MGQKEVHVLEIASENYGVIKIIVIINHTANIH